MVLRKLDKNKTRPLSLPNYINKLRMIKFLNLNPKTRTLLEESRVYLLFYRFLVWVRGVCGMFMLREQGEDCVWQSGGNGLDFNEQLPQGSEICGSSWSRYRIAPPHTHTPFLKTGLLIVNIFRSINFFLHTIPQE